VGTNPCNVKYHLIDAINLHKHRLPCITAQLAYRFAVRRVSAYSSSGLRSSFVSFHKFGVRKPYVFDIATKVAFNVFSRVFVEPADEE
jgi:hypothetical protein